MTDVTWLPPAPVSHPGSTAPPPPSQPNLPKVSQAPIQLLEIYLFNVLLAMAVFLSQFWCRVLFRSGKANGDGGEKENGGCDGGDGGGSGRRTL